MEHNPIYEQKYLLYISYFLIIFFSVSSPLHSADNNEKFHVKWIDEFKTTKQWDDELGLATKLFNIITGENHTNLIRPVNICVYKMNFWILDQASQSVKFIDFQNKESEIIFNGDENKFPSLVGACRTENGNIYFTDSQLNRIYELDSENEETKVSPEFKQMMRESFERNREFLKKMAKY